MKTINRFSIIVAIVLLSFGITSCKWDNKKSQDFTITLNVDTDNIKQSNTSTTCNFGQPTGISNKEFLVKANVGDNITWEGKAIPPSTGIVYIKMIKYIKGSKVFRKDELKGKKKVNGKLIDSTKEGSDYQYKLFFTVINGKNKKNYHIDPYLRVKKK